MNDADTVTHPPPSRVTLNQESKKLSLALAKLAKYSQTKFLYFLIFQEAEIKHK